MYHLVQPHGKWKLKGKSVMYVLMIVFCVLVLCICKECVHMCGVVYIFTCRRKRQYKHEDLNQLLSHYQISSDDLIPLPRDKRKNSATPNSSLSSGSSLGSGRSSKGRTSRPQPSFPTFLPLEVFDNTEFDCRTPIEWLALGRGEYSTVHILYKIYCRLAYAKFKLG